MYHFTTFTPTRAIERHEWKHPYFESLVPGEVYYTTPLIFERVCEHQASMGVRLFEECDGASVMYWDGEDLGTKRVGYFADGRLGDQCIHTAIYRELKWRYPAMDLHSYTRRHEAEGHRIVAYNRDIAGQHGAMPRFLSMALTRPQIEAMDYWVVPTNVGYVYRGRDERTHYELFEDDLGIEIEAKVPYIYLPDIEREAIRTILSGMAGRSVGSVEQGERIASIFLDPATPTCVVQLDASEEARTPPVATWAAVVRGVQRAHPDVLVAVVGSSASTATFADIVGPDPRLLYLSPSPMEGRPYLSAHAILHLTAAAGLVLAPDSFLMHASAAFDVDCVALWQDDPATCEEASIPSPASRIRHYDHVTSIGMTRPVDEIVEHVVGVAR